MEKEVKIFKALGDETRMNILFLISQKGMCSKGISKHLKITEAAVSQHIKILKESELIVGYKIGYHIIYDINEETLERIKRFIGKFKNNDKYYLREVRGLKCTKECKHIKCINNSKIKEEYIMKICFPVDSNKGEESIPYGHFGSAPQFVIYDLESGDIKSIGNGDLGHEHGKCEPIKALSGEMVHAVVVGGIGAGAINKLNSMGIKVYKSINGNIRDNIIAFNNKELKEFAKNHMCNHDGCSH